MSGARDSEKMKQMSWCSQRNVGIRFEKEWIERQETVVSQIVRCMKLRHTLGSDLGSE